ncbi:hypothetical protein [Nostoc sp. PA-18-2419]|uniref:hypothetical protein n=1 Tax=Nostoc sp. PA-18-2419 TaxID=2575443 RepID=UPI0016777086|nr:hypothetical protein [Nostoc sp. PA-18-2419]
MGVIAASNLIARITGLFWIWISYVICAFFVTVILGISGVYYKESVVMVDKKIYFSANVLKVQIIQSLAKSI